MADTDQREPTELNPLWYKSAIIYEVPVRAFYDSNADGIGDFRGLTQKLDYLQDLGATALWLLPFYPSPLKDDGYDIADYYSINPIYGTLDDFKEFMREAKQRGLRVITELVLNHTSDQHPWFQKSRRAPAGSPERDFYVWSDTPEKYKDARIIFKDFEPSNWTWDPVARAYFWHRFYSHQPDLNFENPAVHEAVRKVFEFWMDMGVDGLRLDAVPYLYEREGTSCENLPQTHTFLKDLRAHLDAKYGDRMLLAEANQWPEEAVTYFGAGKGDECHMAFHFPLMPRLFMAVRLEDRVPITDILDQTPQIPATSQWALFLRNHDELTLEMVTDEERDYMYRVYARESKARLNLGIRRRLAPLLQNDRKRIELLNLLLLSLPGTPVLYYGDEIGMGDNIFLGDRNGVRTPMHWSADKNAGFSRVTPQALYAPIILDPEYHYEAINVETQQKNQHSLLWWTKRVLALRKRWQVFGFGSLEFLQPENRKVLAFIRHYDSETVLVVANLSRFPQPVELDLARFNGHVPVELFGRTAFPTITAEPYLLTISPHSAFWFSLEPAAERQHKNLSTRLCKTLRAKKDWSEFVIGKGRLDLESCLPVFLQQRLWFADKGEVKGTRIRELLPLPFDSEKHYLALLLVDYAQSDPEQYLLPLAFATGAEAERIQHETPAFVLAAAEVAEPKTQGVLVDGAVKKNFCRTLFEIIAGGQKVSSEHAEGTLVGTAAPALSNDPAIGVPDPTAARTEQRNTIITYGDKYILKVFRRIESGVHPSFESAQFLAERNFPHVPPFAGALEFVREDGDRTCLGILSGYIATATNGWKFTLDALRRYFDRVRTLPSDGQGDNTISLVELAERGLDNGEQEILGTYAESVAILGKRIGELHLAMASDPDNKDFAPDPFTPFYQRSLYQSLRNHLGHHFRVLRRESKTLPESARPLVDKVFSAQDFILSRYRKVSETPIAAYRIRCHGNLHLGHVLHTGKDFMVIDFEGEPAWTLSARRIKRSPLRDIAAMIRSFHYAADTALRHLLENGNLRQEQANALRPWAQYWERRISAVFLGEYQRVMAKSDLLPKTKVGFSVLLEAFLLDQAITEASRELQHRPDSIRVPLEGILETLGHVGT